MSDTTDRLHLPFIAEAQAQKHVTHNEALIVLDVLVQAVVADRDLADPPASPPAGAAYIVAAAATGDWAGHEGEIAVWTDGAWRFHAPAEGWRVWAADEDALLVHDGAGWQPLGGGDAVVSVNPVPDGKLGVNTTADDTNRLAVKSDAVLFSHDDATPGTGDVRVKVNKKATANTASFLFQDDWSGRAEIGLAGDDDFQFKISADGNAWTTGLRLSAAGAGTISSRLRHLRFGTNLRDLDRVGSASLQLGGSGGSWVCNVQDGSGRVNFRWNATSGPNPKFLVDGDRAVEWDIDGPGAKGLAVRESQANPGAGQAITWTTIFAASRNRFEVNSPLRLPRYNKADLPTPVNNLKGAIVFVEDETGGATIAFCDGSDWRRLQDLAVVS